MLYAAPENAVPHCNAPNLVCLNHVDSVNLIEFNLILCHTQFAIKAAHWNI